MADKELALATVREAGRLARNEPGTGLGHPCAVDAKLALNLERATASARVLAANRVTTAAARLLDPILAEQRTFNDALIEIIHQLDHRTRTQADRIRALEVELAELRAGRAGTVD